MKAPHEKRDLCVALIRGLKKALGEKLHGVYLYGAAAFPKTAPTRDVDLHVILREALSNAERFYGFALGKISASRSELYSESADGNRPTE